jgi:phosphoribosyl-ATP pyrophosphohydrolase
MLIFEVNISKIVSNSKNQFKVDDNFIIDYVREINYFGTILITDNPSFNLLKQVCKVGECYLTMNSPDLELIERGLQSGVKKFVISVKEISKLSHKVSKNVIIGRITLSDNIMLKNELTKVRKEIKAILDEISPYCSEFLIDYNEENYLDKNIVLAITNYLSQLTNAPLTILDPFGQISTALERLGINPYITTSNIFTEEEMLDLFISALDFQKEEGLLPTIVKDEQYRTLMLAYSTKDSLIQALVQKRGVYFSRSRKTIWVKGETSGNTQQLLKARYDCDQDSLLFTVRQVGLACHLERYSCFGNKEFNLLDLYEIILNRIDNPVPNSYTSQISKEEQLILEKVREESYELINYTDQENLIWEIADLFYFILVLMAKKGIKIQDLLNELWKRRNYGK